LYGLLDTSHFLFVPTRADAFGIMYAEGNAYALPAIGTHTGGTPSVLINNTNGFGLPLEAIGSDYADLILSLWTNKQLYKELSRKAYEHFLVHFNWETN